MSSRVWPVLTMAGLLLGWEALVRIAGIPSYTLPAPSLVAQTLWQNLPSLAASWWFTLKITVGALALACAGGFAIAAVFALSRRAEQAFFPLAVLLQVTPIVAIAPLILIYVESTTAALLLCAWIVAFFPILSNTVLGLRAADQHLRDLFTLYGATRWQRLRLLLLPSALPYFLAGLKISGGLSLIGAVTAEMVAGAAGRETVLASRILEASFRTETPKMFAALALLVITGVVIFWMFNALSRRLLGRWHPSERVWVAVALALVSGFSSVTHAQGVAHGQGLAPARDKVTFATNWKAQAAHGGFYQAVADGTYRRYGLDVTILQGGPQVNNRPLLPAGRIDFLMAGNLLHSFDNVKNGVPTVVVAAMFQKDPQALIAHPGQGYEDFAALKNAPVVLIAKDGQFTWWQWLKVTYGFRDEALKPYNFNLGPFLANPKAIQQGYSIAEPVYVEKQGKFKPVVHLLADHGFATYSTLIETRAATVASTPELVQRFVDASIVGWVNYLHGNRKPANALMISDNPEMSEAEIEASVALIKSQGIVESGEALTLGIGAISAERIRDFYAQMVKAGLYEQGDVDLSKVATLKFVNKRVGIKAEGNHISGWE